MADTDADGKMDINEFSIACKLINLKLRGFEIPKVLPPSLTASLKAQTPPSIPPLPIMASVPPRPEPPKVLPTLPQQPLFPTDFTRTTYGQPATISSIPTGIVPPMQTTIPPGQPLVMGVAPIPSVASKPITAQQVIPPIQPGFGQPLIPGATPAPIIPGIPLSNFSPLINTDPVATSCQQIIPGIPPISTITSNITQISPVGSLTGSLTGMPPVITSSAIPTATSTPRASITSTTSLDRASDRQVKKFC